MNTWRVIGLLSLLAGSAHASSWSDLWYRPDQQGQRALQSGDSKRAAELFTDPRRQAYAQIQAAQYPSAAKRLEPFADAPSQYNRGNALAKSGDLQGALAAYDGALKHADLDASLRRDAQHNRDLVARQLQSQKPQQPPPSGQQSSPKDKQDGKSQDSKSQDGKSQDGKSQDGKSQDSKSRDDGKSQGNESKQSSGTSPKSGDEHQSADKDNAQSDKGQNTSAPEPSQQQQQAQQQQAQQEHGQQQQAQQANEARQAKSPAPGSSGEARQSASQQQAMGESTRPQTEQQLALEQWLRQIPDDPGGLLRRKFMIEHLMKQQQVQP